jgi:hypothetical protein
MAYRPIEIARFEEEGFERIRTRGTQAVYASVPRRRALLSWYDGVVYLDEDAVIVDPTIDLRSYVSEETPVAMPEGLTAAVQVLQTTHYTRDLLKRCWDERDHWVNFHWAEEGFFKHEFGWDQWFEHGDPSRFVATTPATGKLVLLPKAIVGHPLDEEGAGAAILNPGGQSFDRRLQLVKEAMQRRAELFPT